MPDDEMAELKLSKDDQKNLGASFKSMMMSSIKEKQKTEEEEKKLFMQD